ncbi:type IV pilus twitching motility protein PilT [Legionella drozanskii]|uniref:Transporter n=1 Tax=Legionella drozanskii LLAP-1 TaxID=1212489 RepID=A0A0W0SWY7_9GAMM|nr:type IV pilus twitching motility protein PilT [Legionella drozanskii]KTC87812.1 transporter [Legionella drozanskii LLAP-1]
MVLGDLLTLAIKKNASDLHLSAGLPPILRIDGDLQTLNLASLDQENLLAVIQKIMNKEQQNIYQKRLEIDFALQFDDQYRLRVNIFTQMRGISAVFRIIPTKIKTIEELDFPIMFKKIASYTKGLILVTGPSGSGKSTTLAALIDYINSYQNKHIITIEDPIEFVHKSNHCLIHQREVYRDTHSFASALRSALREDPNIIMLGELRDYETIRLAMTAAETGHLVFATLHTNSATKAVNRIIDAFPGEEKSTIRTLLSESLQAVIAQTLLKKRGGGRVAAFEIMISTPAIRNLIRENKIAQMYSSIQTGQTMGMQTLEQHIEKLKTARLIAEEETS